MKTERKNSKKQLSKSILEMKFMKKSKEAALAEAEANEGQAVFASELTQAMKLGGSRCVIEQSYVPCEDLIIPRQSYHGMNSELEKLLDDDKKDKVKEVEKDVDVTVEQMALNSTVARKFERGSSKPPRKKQRFLKPTDY